jgi:hypothetical protein
MFYPIQQQQQQQQQQEVCLTRLLHGHITQNGVRSGYEIVTIYQGQPTFLLICFP